MRSDTPVLYTLQAFSHTQESAFITFSFSHNRVFVPTDPAYDHLQYADDPAHA